MVIDSIVVGIVVTAAVAYLAWNFRPRRRRAPAACAASRTPSPVSAAATATLLAPPSQTPARALK